MATQKNTLDHFAEEVLEIMPLLFREYARREDNALVRGKISCPQMVALTVAYEKGEVTVGEIAAVLSSEKSSTSVLLERLVKMRMMRRRHDHEDRRVVWMSLTSKGRKVLDQIKKQKRQSLKAVFSKISVGERGQYLSVLRKVRSNLTHVTLASLLFFFAATPAQAWDWPWAKRSAHVDVIEIQAGQNKGLNLSEAYRLALTRSESVKITAEEMAQAQARFYRSFDYFLPTVDYKITRRQQDVSPSSGTSLDFGRKVQREQRFTFSQPLFSGFREIAALTGTGADKKEQAMKYKRAKETLFIDVMDAYYTYLNARQDMAVLNKIHELMDVRLKDLKERVDLGRSRESELKTSSADMKIVEADLVDARKRSATTRNLLEFYVGESLEGYELVEENGERADWIPDLTQAELRADIVEAEMAYIVAQKKVVSANADLFPEIYLDGNYYTQREGFQRGNDWDVLLTFDIPVFEAGQTLGDIKEAASNREKARLAWEEAKRMAAMDADSALREYDAAQEAKRALAEAEQASRENYEILQKEYSQNLVNNLEVLDALRRFQDVQMRYQESAYEARKSYWRLAYSLGDIPGLTPSKERS